MCHANSLWFGRVSSNFSKEWSVIIVLGVVVKDEDEGEVSDG